MEGATGGRRHPPMSCETYSETLRFSERALQDVVLLKKAAPILLGTSYLSDLHSSAVTATGHRLGEKVQVLCSSEPRRRSSSLVLTDPGEGHPGSCESILV